MDGVVPSSLLPLPSTYGTELAQSTVQKRFCNKHVAGWVIETVLRLLTKIIGGGRLVGSTLVGACSQPGKCVRLDSEDCKLVEWGMYCPRIGSTLSSSMIQWDLGRSQ